MSLFTKKPVTISAIQWTGDNLPEVIEFTGKHPCWGEWFKDMDDYAAHVRGDGSKFKIFTLEGVMDALPGDWIIRGIRGEFYPCKPDIFVATYSPASTFNRPMSNIDKQALREEFQSMQDHYSDPADRDRQVIYIAAEALLDELEAEGCRYEEITTYRDNAVKKVVRLRTELTAAEKRIAELESDNAYIRNRHKELDLLIGKNILVMQAAIIEWQGTGDARKGLAWIYNTLFGPGELPDEAEKDAQVYFDRKYAPLDEELMALHRWFWEQSETKRAAAAAKGE